MKKSIIIAPLNWGLGHATRSIPLINKYIDDQWDVRIASDGDSLQLLKMEFPELTFLELPSYNIKYATGSFMAFAILRQLPKLKKAIQQEKEWLDNYLLNNDIDMVISDNRFGMFSSKCHSVFITHQLSIQLPVAMKTINKVNHGYIRNFDECWVPDFEGDDNLSGKLSHGNFKLNVKYTGPISRFTRKDTMMNYRVTAVLSGPEPSRGLLEEKLIKQLRNMEDSVLVRGVFSTNNIQRIGKLKVIDHLPQHELESLYNQSRLIISRSGYTSIMDLHKLKKEAILIPTPGQSEQEYLAKHLKTHPQFHFISENKLNETLLDRINEFDFIKGQTSIK